MTSRRTRVHQKEARVRQTWPDFGLVQVDKYNVILLFCKTPHLQRIQCVIQQKSQQIDGEYMVGLPLNMDP